MIFNTKCKECNEPLELEGQYNKPQEVNCKCGANFNYTMGRPVKRPEHLDIVIRGGGGETTNRHGSANGHTVH